MWVTESGDAGCGGNTWASTYADVPCTLNELGEFTTVTDGIIFHNTLASSDYGFLKHGTFVPRPNYFAVLLWNRIMGATVYDCGAVSEGAHVYAHSRKDGVAYLIVNNSNETTTVELPVLVPVKVSGTLGNAATNVVFPLNISCTALALLFGIGGASCYNLALGRGEKERAPQFMGSALSMLVICGVILCLITELFTTPILVAFGTPEDVFPYAKEYARAVAVGFPFLLLTTGGGHLIRADGSPKMTMVCNLSGAILNIFLDALFVFGFKWGMAGAAWATVIGQVVSGTIVIVYMAKYKRADFHLRHFVVKMKCVAEVAAIGMASFFNQVAMMVVQIVLNNLLKHYGALSIYGAATPIPCSGIAMKSSQLFFSVVIGIAQGSQPIESFNYGARNYDRVKKALRLALVSAGCVSLVSFIVFQTMPRQILSLFENGTEEYFTFGVMFMRRFLFCMFLNFLQPVTSTFFTSIGKPIKGVFLSMTRQIIFLLPLLLLLPKFMGIEGIVYAAPIADFMAAGTALIMIAYEVRAMKN